jgi:hypothetical protein
MSGEPSRRPGEVAFAAILVALSLWLFWQATRISGFSGLATPGIFPMLAAGLMTVSSAVVLRGALRRAPAPGGIGRFLAEVTPLRLVLVLGLVALYVATLPWLGFILASALFLLASMGLLWRRRPLAVALVAAVSLALVYVVFRVLFQVVLPEGTLLRGVF